mmetsp:Transcript_61332/g.168418  ORF Transcript_61332/g.168418 Transcript_61332/m.168418 type:complete len:272 (+) Transcript_61332:2634-3449(+)
MPAAHPRGRVAAGGRRRARRAAAKGGRAVHAHADHRRMLVGDARQAVASGEHAPAVDRVLRVGAVQTALVPHARSLHRPRRHPAQFGHRLALDGAASPWEGRVGRLPRRGCVRRVCQRHHARLHLWPLQGRASQASHPRAGRAHRQVLLDASRDQGWRAADGAALPAVARGAGGAVGGARHRDGAHDAALRACAARCAHRGALRSRCALEGVGGAHATRRDRGADDGGGARARATLRVHQVQGQPAAWERGGAGVRVAGVAGARRARRHRS